MRLRPGRDGGGFRPRSALALSLLAVLGAIGAGCAEIAPRSLPVHDAAAGGRFSVSISPHVVLEFRNHGLNLGGLTRAALGRIDHLLPGPPTRVALVVGDPAEFLSDTGTTQFTDPETGAITIGFLPSWAQEPADIQLDLGRSLAHGVLRSVRVVSGPGLGTTLLDQLVSQGMATAFDLAAFPGPPDPWVHALAGAQECQQWVQLKPALQETVPFTPVMYGGVVSSPSLGEIWLPPLTGLAIGYDIVAGYLSRHPGSDWSDLAVTPGREILAASGYRPCGTS
ncbi:MAG: DUF2268 domain-containing putative Zn-dependent protease [Candidatus Dormibacteria bacterium]